MTERSLFWRRHLEAIEAEGISTSAYARREGLALGLLYQCGANSTHRLIAALAKIHFLQASLRSGSRSL